MFRPPPSRRGIGHGAKPLFFMEENHMSNNKKDETVNSTNSTVPTLIKTVDGMTYRILFFFSEKTKETFRDKRIRVIKNGTNKNNLP